MVGTRKLSLVEGDQSSSHPGLAYQNGQARESAPPPTATPTAPHQVAGLKKNQIGWLSLSLSLSLVSVCLSLSLSVSLSLVSVSLSLSLVLLTCQFKAAVSFLKGVGVS